MQQTRQGDVLIVPEREVPARMRPGQPKAHPAAPEQGRVILARGEATGHHHSLAADSGAALFRPDDLPPAGVGLAWLDVPAATPLQHQEHDPLRIGAGAGGVIIQAEWSDADEPRRVED